MSENKNQGDVNTPDSALPSSGLNAEDRMGLVNDQRKLQNLAAVMEKLAPEVKKRVEFLRNIQVQYDEFESKFREERAALEAKYQKIYEPLYTMRYEIVNGLVEVEGVVDDSMEDIAAEDKANEGNKGVPGFWLTAMKANEDLIEEIEINEQDEDALKHLKDIKCSKLDGDRRGFKLEFFFSPNPYFKNSVLSKTYLMFDDDDDEPILKKAIGSEIEWFPGKCLTQKVIKKKPKKGLKNTKLITKTEICLSFFNFFSPPNVPEENDVDFDEETDEQLEDQLEQDYEVGTIIRDKVISHAVSWFTGEAEELEDIEGDEDDDNEDDNEEDEEDDDEEGEEEDDDEDDDEEGEKEDNDEDEDEEEEAKRRKFATGLKEPGECKL